METVEVANKELKVETRLRNIENRWKEEQLGFVRHRDTEVTFKARTGAVNTRLSLRTYPIRTMPMLFSSHEGK